MRLHGAMLFVKDLDRMTSFYSDVLGLQPVAETKLDNWVEFRSNGSQFSLHAIPRAIHLSTCPMCPVSPAQARLTRRQRPECGHVGHIGHMRTTVYACR